MRIKEKVWWTIAESLMKGCVATQILCCANGANESFGVMMMHLNMQYTLYKYKACKDQHPIRTWLDSVYMILRKIGVLTEFRKLSVRSQLRWDDKIDLVFLLLLCNTFDNFYDTITTIRTFSKVQNVQNLKYFRSSCLLSNVNSINMKNAKNTQYVFRI